MNVRRGQLVGSSLIVLGIILLIIGIIMPYYKSWQHLDGKGPNVEFSSSRSYWIKTYIIPPIDAGNPISLNLLSDKAESTTVLLAPFDQQTQTIMGPAVVNAVFGKDQKGLVIFTPATRSAPYMLMITSYNSSYTFYLDSVWSPFYQFRAFTTYGLGILPVGLVMLYYDSISEKRERIFEKALRTAGKRNGSA